MHQATAGINTFMSRPRAAARNPKGASSYTLTEHELLSLVPCWVQVQTKGHRQHLEKCSGRKRQRRVPQEDEALDNEDVDLEEDEEEELAEIHASKA